jgi:transposase
VLASEAPDWLLPHVDDAWAERYGRRVEQYRLPKAEQARHALAVTIGQDGYRLLEAVFSPDAPQHLRTLDAVETLRQVWVQQYYRSTIPETATVRWRTKEEQPPTAQIISSPYDVEARYKTKRDTHWLGYKLHLTETCDDDLPNVITQVATTPATTDDKVVSAPIQQALAAKGLLPEEHLVDSGYVDADLLVESKAKHAITVVGPVIGDPSWQAHNEDGLAASQFVLDWEAEQAHCPAGKVSDRWTPTTDAHGNGVIAIRFARKDCQGCGLRERCTKSERGVRSLTVRPREQHIALQSARAWQESEEFKTLYNRRAGVEGSFTQANRRCDLRHARYIGRAKTHLQHLLTAIAINLLRLVAWLCEVPRAKTRTSSFTALMAARC